MLLATASADRTARLWDARTGRELLALKAPPGTIPDTVHYATFSPDGARLATRLLGGGTRLWDVPTGALLPGGPDFPLRATPLSPDGRRFALPQGDSVRVVDLSLSDAEAALRRWATRPDPAWHSVEARRLSAERQPAASAFHAAFANLPPAAVAEVRYGVALAASGHYPDAAFAFLRAATTQEEEAGLPALPR
jgi:hypothetical protein